MSTEKDNKISGLLEQLHVKLPAALDPNHAIILVEQQQDLRLIVTHHLNKVQYRNVFQSKNGLEALDRIKLLSSQKQPIGLIIAEWDSPILSGMDLLNELKEGFELSRPPFCVTVDNVTKEKIMYAVEQGVDEILAKPYTLGDLLPKMRSAFKTFNNPNNPEQAYEIAKDALRNGSEESASLIYNRLMDSSQKIARPLVGLAHIAKSKKDFDGALKFLDQAEARNSNYVHSYVLRGEILYEKGDIPGALVSFQKAIDISPLNAIHYLNAADILMKNEQYQHVIDLMGKAEHFNLKFSQMYKYLSKANFALKDYAKASHYIRTALSEDPDNSDYLNQYAISLKSLGKFDEAVKTYNKIIKLDPTDFRALYNKAILYKDTGDNAEAIRIMEKVVEKFPEFEQAKTKLEDMKRNPTSTASAQGAQDGAA